MQSVEVYALLCFVLQMTHIFHFNHFSFHVDSFFRDAFFVCRSPKTVRNSVEMWIIVYALMKKVVRAEWQHLRRGREENTSLLNRTKEIKVSSRNTSVMRICTSFFSHNHILSYHSIASRIQF